METFFTQSVDKKLTTLLFNRVESEDADRKFNLACAKDLIHELTDQQNPTERKTLSVCSLQPTQDPSLLVSTRWVLVNVNKTNGRRMLM